MPGMNGLELMEAARARGFDGQFVIVSGYGDFDYAKQAMRVGVAGYLLKPIEPLDAGEVLAQVRKVLVGREASSSQRSAAYHHDLTALLSGRMAPTDALPRDELWRLATWGSPLPLERVLEIHRAFPEGAASTHIVEDKEYLALHWPRDGQEPSWDNAEALLGGMRREFKKSELCLLVSLPGRRSRSSSKIIRKASSMRVSMSDELRPISANKLGFVFIHLPLRNYCSCLLLHAVSSQVLRECIPIGWFPFLVSSVSRHKKLRRLPTLKRCSHQDR